MGDKTWGEIKDRYPLGADVTGRVKVKFQHGVFLELDDTPEARAFIDLLSYNPDDGPKDGGLPEVGEVVTGVVAELVDRDQQLRIRVGRPFWESTD
ncbi:MULTISPECIES: hypothetical protein [unclassified Streptomyces]|uniref:hypothetical protein n=1 Tax=unclassified Streptomyces TaxID=2593676 RepID=UPI0004BE0EC6|nr:MULTISPECIES: hypothetical protein [unclassified Streptomyces]